MKYNSKNKIDEEIIEDEELDEAVDEAEAEDISDEYEDEEVIEEDEELIVEDDFAEEDEEDKPVKKKRKKWPIVLAIVLGALILIVAGILVAVNIITGGFKSTKLNKEDLGIVETTTAEDSTEKINKIINIAFFGIDTRDFLPEIGDQYRSDSIIVMSINPINNTIKMISVLRDSKVPIAGHDATKINAAYQYGGPTLAINTLNTNFQLDIEDYVTVDFGELEEVIDIMGGVDIDITWAEAEWINYYAETEMHYEGEGVIYGHAHLNGAQAVSYARIRKIDTDVSRSGRQQTVLTALFNKIKAMPKSDYPALINKLLPCVETSLSYIDIMSLATSVDLSSAELLKFTVPDLNYQPNIWGGIDDTGAWVWVYDLDYAAERIHTIIYGTEGNGEGETEVETCDPNTSDVTY